MEQKLKKILQQMPEQINLANLSEQQRKELLGKFGDKKLTNIIVCGMGGSSLAAGFLSNNYPIYLCRDYQLPLPFVSQESLIICISYSGNTEETLATYNQAKKLDCNLIALSSGGKLEQQAQRDNVALIKLKSKNIEPRFSVIEQISALIQIFSTLGFKPAQKDFLLDTINPKEFFSFYGESETIKIAQKIIEKIVLIYASQNNQAIAYYWKALFNENSKIPCFWNVYPELSHNELMHGQGLANDMNKFFILSLLDEADHPRIQKRMTLSNDIFEKKGIETTTIKIKGRNTLEKIFGMIIFGNMISFSLAEKLDINPIDPDVREDFKEKMKI